MRPALLAWAILLLPLSGCAEEKTQVEATLLPGEGAPVIFELVIDVPRGDALRSFDPEQHVHLETAGGTLRPSIVNVDPESDHRHAEYGAGFDADRGQDMTLVVQGFGDEQRFPFEA